MVIYKAKNYQDMSRKAANIISAQIIMKPDCVLGLATGSSPVGTYKQLIEWYNKGDLDFSKVTSINLDEYKGLSPENDQSYRYFMNYNLFNHVNIDKSRTFVPDGLESDSQKACDVYNEIIRQQGGIDLQLLGLGHNGHIGFNEPGAAFEKETHCVDLTESTIEANKRFFASEDDVPRQAYTMGIMFIIFSGMPSIYPFPDVQMNRSTEIRIFPEVSAWGCYRCMYPYGDSVSEHRPSPDRMMRLLLLFLWMLPCELLHRVLHSAIFH